MAAMEFRRINSLPPYVFTIIDSLKVEARRAGIDVIDLGFGNPDLPSPDIAVDKLTEAVHNPRNHRYSSSRGIPKLRQAVADLYLRRFGVDARPRHRGHQHHRGQGGLLPPDVDAAAARRRRARAVAVLPDPHLRPAASPAPTSARSPLGTGGDDFFDSLTEAWEYSWPKPRVIVMSFPHNPTTTCVDLDFMQKVVDFAREKEVVVVHDNAYADLGFDGYSPPSILQAEGAKEVAVELYSMTKSFSMAGWRVAFMVGNAEVVARAGQAQELPRLRHVPADPDRGHGHAQRGARATRRWSTRSTRPAATRSAAGCNRIGWEVEPPQGTMFVWAPDPRALPRDGLGRVRQVCW